MTDRQPIALVTGGAQRVGAAIVRDLAAHGFAVAIHCNGSRDRAEALASELSGAGGLVVVVQADLCERATVQALCGEVEDLLGPVSLLVNNASLFHDDAVLAPDADTWRRHFAVHVEAPSLLAGAMANALPPEMDGLVVNMIDQRVWKTTPRFFSYTLSKSALWTATRTMAQALAPRIRVNAIGPGPTLKNARQTQADFDAQTRALPLGRGPELEEFGATIRYFWQARSITGQMIALDGGQHLAWQTPDVAGVAE